MNFKIKKSEFDHFSNLASEWWLKNGKFKILHEIQPIRIKYIQDVLNEKHLDKMKILDLGCGGGLISEELSKLGANVTGIDFIKDNINIARIHAQKNNLNINYKTLDFENEKISSKFDVIVIFEVLEHLSDWKSFIKKIQYNLKPNGVLIISTINKNLISKLLTIDLAENFLHWIPRNTHHYYKFIRPKELEFFLNQNGFTNISFKGLKYNLFKKKWILSANTNVNYFCSCFLN
ncbi:MAG: bifunctional 2-polyprenyl-6-hydroxyphenol methylase/3-demethylubiquinol 3-O-methyltransferase UbiG [Alphaproteobacteria bacterium]